MNGWLKGIGAAIILAILGVLGEGWLSHADQEDLKAEKIERKEGDAKLEAQDDKIVGVIEKIREKLAEQSEINAAQIAALEQINKALED